MKNTVKSEIITRENNLQIKYKNGKFIVQFWGIGTGEWHTIKVTDSFGEAIGCLEQ